MLRLHRKCQIRKDGHASSLFLSIPMLVFFVATALGSSQNGNYSATYDVSLAGLGLAQISISAVVVDNKYTLNGVGKPAFIGTLFLDGSATVNSNGRLNGSNIIPDQYNLKINFEDDVRTVNMKIKNSNISSLLAEPELDVHDDRVPVTKVHHKNIIDPVSAIFMPMINDTANLESKICDRNVPIYDGWYRYDLNLSFKGMERVKNGKFKSDAIVCNVRWTPVAGHRSSKETIKFMAENRNMEIWMVPLKGTRMLVPYYIGIKTKTGTLRFKVDEISM